MEYGDVKEKELKCYMKGRIKKTKQTLKTNKKLKKQKEEREIKNFTKTCKF